MIIYFLHNHCRCASCPSWLEWAWRSALKSPEPTRWPQKSQQRGTFCLTSRSGWFVPYAIWYPINRFSHSDIWNLANIGNYHPSIYCKYCVFCVNKALLSTAYRILRILMWSSKKGLSLRNVDHTFFSFSFIYDGILNGITFLCGTFLIKLFYWRIV